MAKKYPSQIRYEENNPSMTFRVKKEEKELIENMAKRAGKSISELVRVALLELEENFAETLEDTWNDGQKYGLDAGKTIGYQKAKNEYEITYPCTICGSSCTLPPNSDCHKAVVQFLKENRWAHGECVNKK